MKEIQTRRFAGALQRLFGIQGPVNLVLNETLQPTFEIMGPRAPEHIFSVGQRRFGTRFTVAAGGAGTFASIRLRNPPDSKSLIIVEKYRPIGNTAGQHFLATQVGGVFVSTPIASVFGLDTRGRPFGVAAMQTFTSTPGAVQLVSGNEVFVDSDTLSMANRELDIVLGPDSYLLVETHTANVALDFILRWREVLLAPQETTPGYG